MIFTKVYIEKLHEHGDLINICISDTNGSQYFISKDFTLLITIQVIKVQGIFVIRGITLTTEV